MIPAPTKTRSGEEATGLERVDETEEEVGLTIFFR
jgi:hypothetical protein